MSHAELYADVHITLALWRRRRIPANTIWQQLGNTDSGRSVTWHTVRTFMLGWLSGQSTISLQRVG